MNQPEVFARAIAAEVARFLSLLQAHHCLRAVCNGGS